MPYLTHDIPDLEERFEERDIKKARKRSCTWFSKQSPCRPEGWRHARYLGPYRTFREPVDSAFSRATRNLPPPNGIPPPTAAKRTPSPATSPPKSRKSLSPSRGPARDAPVHPHPHSHPHPHPNSHHHHHHHHHHYPVLACLLKLATPSHTHLHLLWDTARTARKKSSTSPTKAKTAAPHRRSSSPEHKRKKEEKKEKEKEEKEKKEREKEKEATPVKKPTTRQPHTLEAPAATADRCQYLRMLARGGSLRFLQLLLQPRQEA